MHAIFFPDCISLKWVSLESQKKSNVAHDSNLYIPCLSKSSYNWCCAYEHCSFLFSFFFSFIMNENKNWEAFMPKKKREENRTESFFFKRKLFLLCGLERQWVEDWCHFMFNQIRKSAGSFVLFSLSLELFIYFHWAPLILWIWTMFVDAFSSSTMCCCFILFFSSAFVSMCSIEVAVWTNWMPNKLSTPFDIVDFVFVIGKPFKFQGNFCVFCMSFLSHPYLC